VPNPPARAVYTHGHHESVLRSHRWRTAQNSAGYLLGVLKPDMRILDIGCGPGTITADLAGRVPEGTVTGIDTEPAVLAQAREAARERGLANLEFTRGDVYALDYPDGAFRVVHAHQVLQHLADPLAALREMRRVCQPGGYVAFRDADYGAMAWSPRVRGLDGWLALYRRVARANGGEPDAGRYLHSWARQAGFTDVTVSASAWAFTTPEDRTWWGGLWADRTVASSYATMAVGDGHASREDLERIADAWRTWAAEPDGWFSVPNGEVLCRA
jgi:ubiquinone/menaquinone biosynthesis C-methylase UbiE